MLTPDVMLVAEVGRPLRADDAPAGAGAVLLSDASGHPILLATTADARAFLRKRLGGDAPAGEPVGTVLAPSARPGRAAPRTDLASIAHRLELWDVGSGLEADLTFLSIARTRMPETAAALTERWRAWFVQLDPAAPTPTWRKTNLGDASTAALPTLIGPLATKDAAGRFAEAMVDAFDQCRFPRELSLAPHGTACAYKEMGRCPAPCDGSEAMDSYRVRVADAIATLRLDPSVRGGGLESAMHEAAGRHDFEAAAALKSRLDRLAACGKPSTREARPMDDFRFVAILGSGRAGWARAWWIDARTCEAIADLDGSRPKEAIGALNDALAMRRAGVDAGPLDPVLLGIVGRHLLAPAARRRGGFLRLAYATEADPLDRDAASRLLRSAARTDESDVEEFDRATLA